MKRYLSLLVAPDETQAEKWFQRIGEENIDFADAIRPGETSEHADSMKAGARKLRSEAQKGNQQALHVFIAGETVVKELMISSLPRLDVERALRTHRLLDEYDRVAVAEGDNFRVLKDRGVMPDETNNWTAMNNVDVLDKERNIPSQGGYGDHPVMMGPDASPTAFIGVIEKFIAEVPGRTMRDVLSDVQVINGENECDLIIKLTTCEPELAERLKALGMTVAED
jgi:hypothetical protein